jgi:hypothetical protein
VDGGGRRIRSSNPKLAVDFLLRSDMGESLVVRQSSSTLKAAGGPTSNLCPDSS